jgi:hypothetical protein
VVGKIIERQNVACPAKIGASRDDLGRWEYVFQNLYNNAVRGEKPDAPLHSFEQQ